MRYTPCILATLALSSQSFARLIPRALTLSERSTADAKKSKATEGDTTIDGVDISTIPGLANVPENNPEANTEGRTAVPAGAVALDATGWIASADSAQDNFPASNAIDGNTGTFWHSRYSPDLHQEPHFLQIDMRKISLVNSVSYLPRQDGSSNGNIGGHEIRCSTGERDANGNLVFTHPRSLGTWADTSAEKVTVFEATRCQYLLLQITTEAGNRGPWASVAELKIYTTTTPAPAFQGTFGGEWSPTIDFPLVPVSVAVEFTTGNLLTWSSYAANSFFGNAGGHTLTSTFYPANASVGERNVAETQHDMFCEGLNLDASGAVISSGGNDAAKLSIYNPASNHWSAYPQMHIPRGYHAQVTTSDGRSFTIGGSWSGGRGGKNGEIYSSATKSWTLLSNAQVSAILTADAQGIYRADNHAWLFAWKGGSVFHAGPSKQMNWFYPEANKPTIGAGNRANDVDSMCGNAVMYDAVAGKILTVGGATSYQGVDSTSNAHIITIGTSGTKPTVQTINNMAYQRIFHNSVVQPDGNVFVVGGQVHGAPFSDATSQLTPELFIASTGHFFSLPPMAIPRNYHSTAVLLPDATIFVGGGGLCGSCATNHYDGQVFSPGYLFNPDGSRAAQPVITGATANIKAGGTITATTNADTPNWSMIRMSSTTHTVNTDQRRIPLTATKNGNTYTMKTPTDYGIMVPGYYMLFAMNAVFTPSKAAYVLVSL